MITPLTKHDNCEVELVGASEDSKHYASLRCVNCNKWIQWLSKEDAYTINPDHIMSKVSPNMIDVKWILE